MHEMLATNLEPPPLSGGFFKFCVDSRKRAMDETVTMTVGLTRLDAVQSLEGSPSHPYNHF